MATEGNANHMHRHGGALISIITAGAEDESLGVGASSRQLEQILIDSPRQKTSGASVDASVSPLPAVPRKPVDQSTASLRLPLALPLDLLPIIFSYIPSRPRLLVIACVCRSWRRAALASITHPPKLNPWHETSYVMQLLSLCPNLEELPPIPVKKQALPQFWNELAAWQKTHPLNVRRHSISASTALGACVAFLFRLPKLTELALPISSLNRLDYAYPFLPALPPLVSLSACDLFRHHSFDFDSDQENLRKAPYSSSLSALTINCKPGIALLELHASHITSLSLCTMHSFVWASHRVNVDELSLDWFGTFLTTSKVRLPDLRRLAVCVKSTLGPNILPSLPALEQVHLFGHCTLVSDNTYPGIEPLIVEHISGNPLSNLIPSARSNLTSLGLTFPTLCYNEGRALEEEPRKALHDLRAALAHTTSLLTLSLAHLNNLREKDYHALAGLRWHQPHLRTLALSGWLLGPLEMIDSLLLAGWPLPALQCVRITLTPTEVLQRSQEISFATKLVSLLDELEKHGVQEVCIAGLTHKIDALIEKKRTLQWLELAFVDRN